MTRSNKHKITSYFWGERANSGGGGDFKLCFVQEKMQELKIDLKDLKDSPSHCIDGYIRRV